MIQLPSHNYTGLANKIHPSILTLSQIGSQQGQLR